VDSNSERTKSTPSPRTLNRWARNAAKEIEFLATKRRGGAFPLIDPPSGQTIIDGLTAEAVIAFCEMPPAIHAGDLAAMVDQ
jgi:hypothetical protein